MRDSALFLLSILCLNALGHAAPDAPLTKLDLAQVRTGWGQALTDQSVDGHPLSIGGRKFAHGLGMHAPGSICLALDGQGGSFHSFVGVDDEVAPKQGTVVFRAWADGKEIWTSGTMRTGDAAREVKLELAGVKQLLLRVEDADDGNSNDHADWAEAVLTGEAASARIVPFTVRKTFPHPERIRYDGHALQIEGKDTFLYCATFHYFRTPKELWPDRFRKIKEAGFNAVETYIPWNWHERTMPSGLDDFSHVDLGEIEAWLKMAQDEFGLYTVARPGPFICAEWAGGGYPRWLGKFGPGTGGYWLRGADQAHIDWSVHWYQAVGKLIAREQLTRKPVGGKGLILVQIENEYDAHSCPGKPKLLRALYDAVRSSGIEVPVFTCLTSECRGSQDPVLSQVFDCDNYYVGLTEAFGCATRMASLRQKQTDAPGLVTELQGGWFSTIGGGLSEDHYSDARHFQAISLMSMLGGAGGLTPYVFAGGTHFGNWGARGQTTSYDYNAAIREWGGRGPKYLAAQGLGEFLREHGTALLRTEGGPCEMEGAPKSLVGGVRVAPDGTRFVFLLNNDPKNPAAGRVKLVPSATAKPADPIYNIDQNERKVLVQTDTGSGGPQSTLPPFEVSYDLEPLEARVLVVASGKDASLGTWYPKPQPAIARPAGTPEAVRIAKAWKRSEDFQADWRPLPDGKSLPELGVGDQRYTLYRARFELSAEEAARLRMVLVNSFSRDIVSVSVNGRLPKRAHPSEAYAAAASRNTATSNSRIGPQDFDNRFDATGLLQSGSNEMVFLYENIGHEHGYVPMEELCGIHAAGLGETETALTKPLSLEVATDLGGIKQGWASGAVSAEGWTPVDLDALRPVPRKGNNLQPKEQPDGLLTWWRLEFELPAAQPDVFRPWALRLLASGNGEMYLNGHDIGRHYQAGPQREFFLPECWLCFGAGQRNVLVLGLRQTADGAVVRSAEVAPYPDSAEIARPTTRK